MSKGTMSQRAAALTSLALADAAPGELYELAIASVSHALPDAAVGVYTRCPGVDVWDLAAHVGLSDAGAGEVAAHAYAASEVVVAFGSQESGPSGLLRVCASLSKLDLEFIGEIAHVLSVAIPRAARSEALERSERRLVEAQRISHVGSYDFEIATNTNLWSDQLYRIYGCEPQSFNASYERFLELILPEDREHVIAVHQRALETLDPFEMEERIVWPDGQIRTLSSWGEVVTDAEGRPARMIGICWDITERKEIEGRLVHEALHDGLTGLPNRVLLMDRLAQRIAAAPRRVGQVAVLFVDVDRFKIVNDSLGHEAGDEVLVELAKRFSSVMRPGDTVARFGGDEFVVLCEDLVNDGEALLVAERLQGETLRPMTIAGSDLVVAVSIGIAVAISPTDLASDLLRDADAAMYRAKQLGRGRWVVFADEMRDKAVLRLDTEQQLRVALSDDQLRLHYQPVVGLATGRVVGVEALVRWQHPTRGLLAPDEFVSVAEDAGLIARLDDWVMRTAFAQLALWQEEYPHLTMSVNVSGAEFVESDLVARVAMALADTGVDPGHVTLEITESILMREAEETMTILRELRGLGVRLHIDDFGTGYSSLSYLRRFRVDALKVDKSFVAGVGGNAEDLAIVHAIVALAKALGLETMAEGVEELDQLFALRALGFETAQGYLMSRPLPPERLAPLLGTSMLTIPEPRAALDASCVVTQVSGR